MSEAGDRALAFWQATRPIEWVEHYRQSAWEPWRDALIDAVRPWAPFQSVLELGCHCGPNVARWREIFGRFRYVGLDCNGAALAAGQRQAVRDGYGDVSQWIYGAVQDLTTWPSEPAFDIVLSSSCLSVIAPEELPSVLAEMRRLSSRLIAIQEPREDRAFGPFQQWNHDYEGLVSGWPDWTWQPPREGVLVGVRV